MVLSVRKVLPLAVLLLAPSIDAQTKKSMPTNGKYSKPALAAYTALKSVENELLQVLASSDKERKTLEAKIEKVRGDLALKNTELNRLTMRRKTLEAEMIPLESKVRERLKARQVSLKRGEAFLRLLLQKGGATRFMTARGYLNSIAAQDLKLIRTYHKRKRQLVLNETETKSSTKVLKGLEVELAQKAVKIDEINQRRFVLLEEAKRKKRKAEKAAIALGLRPAVQTDVAAETRFLARKGRMPRPVKGQPYRRFGTYKDQRFKTRHRSDGWWFDMSRHSEVRTVGKGRVIFRGPFNGYGQMVIVQHTSRYHTIYAHLTKIQVELNQPLETASLIGYVSKSKGNRRPRLYFEIRKDKKPSDPRNYLGQ